MDEYNPNLPCNPGIFELFKERMEEHRNLVKSYPSGTKFECKGCGDCCRWAYSFFEIELSLFERLIKLGVPQPHGAWLLIDDEIRIGMPVFPEKSKGDLSQFSFTGLLPPSHLEWLRFTGRRHGYWRLVSLNRVVIYSPVDCIHLTEEILCDDYENRPQLCREYYCGKYPLEEEAE